MSTNAPQTLSVKRKRNEAPVDSLVVERNDKRLKSAAFPPSNIDSTVQGDSSPLKRKLNDPETQAKASSSSQHNEPSDKRSKGHTRSSTIVWRRIRVPHAYERRSLADPPPETPTRRFHVSHTDGERILIEHRDGGETQRKVTNTQEQSPQTLSAPQPNIAPSLTPAAPRKRPGAGTALQPRDPKLTQKPTTTHVGPSEETIRAFEKFSAQVENDETAVKTPVSPPRPRMKFQPKVPKLRYKDRHPEASTKAADPNAMDVDGAEYVYDMYEIVMPDADGNTPEPEGTVGFIVLEEEDEEWWFGDESDVEFDTDEDDENAEDYYTNDYPEEELSSDDEFDRDPYKYYHGSDDEEYDLREDAANGDEPAAMQSIGQRKVQGYW
ncbi:hypothetical protein B0J11DRAFT_308542 [Dendryphion nanum]|uniref:Transcription factor Iwr1 domain-containing protein n=1 Tax=Dendryphion nanum TaxID=256645 RepID=A0A9P9DTP3_9PLEO|nr:hypothetical protein B0J11DRAFT_308542 [Dendryphion nanum]